MITYRISQVLIGRKMIEEIVDENGVKWYPMMKFIEQVLCRYERISTFLGTRVENYMKIIQYPANRKFQDRLLNTWCINERGVVFLLKRMEITRGKKDSGNRYLFRERGFYEACVYFGVKKTKTKLDPNITCCPPKQKGLDLWSVLCLKYDHTITGTTEWRKCTSCDKFYPNNGAYFGAPRMKEHCLKCQGRRFVCKNKAIQSLYKVGGLELLKWIYEDNEVNVMKTLKEMINKGEEKK